MRACECDRRHTHTIRILEECSEPTSAEGGSQSVLKVLQSLAGCAVYGMLDGLSSNVSSGHNTKMYTTAPGPLLYAICNPHATYTYRYNPASAGAVTVISRVRQPRATQKVSKLTYFTNYTSDTCTHTDTHTHIYTSHTQRKHVQS